MHLRLGVAHLAPAAHRRSPLPDARFVPPQRPGATALPGLPNGLPNLDDPQLRQMLRGLMQPR